jgi:hypothetical protein
MLVNLEVIRANKKDTYPFVGPSFNHILSVIDKRAKEGVIDNAPYVRLNVVFEGSVVYSRTKESGWNY